MTAPKVPLKMSSKILLGDDDPDSSPIRPESRVLVDLDDDRDHDHDHSSSRGDEAMRYSKLQSLLDGHGGRAGSPPSSAFRDLSGVAHHHFQVGRVQKTLAFGLMLATLLVAFFTTLVYIGVTSSGSSHGKQGLEVQMSGTFRLRGYDNRFESYLRSLGFGDLELSMIKGYKENITIAEPVRPSKTWSMAIKTQFGLHRINFELGKAFNISWAEENERSSSSSTLPTYMQHMCDLEGPAVLVCHTRSSRWNTRSRLTFTHTGMIDEKTNLDAGISSNKTYTRVLDYSAAGSEEAATRPPPAQPGGTNPEDNGVWSLWE